MDNKLLIKRKILEELRIIKKKYCSKYKCVNCPLDWNDGQCEKKDLENILKSLED